jgi:enoyl-CoA hydratase/carnithine racemase
MHQNCVRAKIGRRSGVKFERRLTIPGAAAAQHLARLMGRGRALEVLLSADDYDAELGERYGWINRALPADMLGDFVKSLAHRIAALPAAGQATIKERVNAIALPPVNGVRRDFELYADGLRSAEAQSRLKAAFTQGFQTREGEMELARMLPGLAEG